MNGYEIDDLADYVAAGRFDERPVLRAAVTTLVNLRDWVNSHSDGWAYWQPPSRAAAKLIALVESGVDWRGRLVGDDDVDPASYKAALTPIKAFRTKANKGGRWGIRTTDTCQFDIVDPA